MYNKTTDLAYLTGLFDIGGCIKISIPFESEEASLYVWITSKNTQVMKFLELFGAKVDQKADGQFRAKWRDKYAFNLLKNMMPYIKIKREQAKVGIEFFAEKLKDNTIDTEKYQIRLKLAKSVTS